MLELSFNSSKTCLNSYILSLTILEKLYNLTLGNMGDYMR